MSKPMTPRERIDETFRHPYGCDCEVIDLEVAYQIADELTAALQRAEKAERERDLAIAHDRQPYPTAHAYETVCAVLNETKAELVQYREAEKALPEEPQALALWRAMDASRPLEAVRYIDKLIAHAAALQAERDAMRGRLAKIMGCLGTVLRDNGFGDNDVAIIRSELTVAIKLSTIDAARGKK